MQNVAIHLFKWIAHYGNSSKQNIFILLDKPNFLVLHNFTKCLFGTKVNQIERKYLNGCLVFSIHYFWLRKKCLQNFCLIKKWMMLEIVDKCAFEAMKLPDNLVLICRSQGPNLVLCSLCIICEICFLLKFDLRKLQLES